MNGFSKFQNSFLLTMGPAFQCNLNFQIPLRDKKVRYRARFGQNFRKNEKTHEIFFRQIITGSRRTLNFAFILKNDKVTAHLVKNFFRFYGVICHKKSIFLKQ